MSPQPSLPLPLPDVEPDALRDTHARSGLAAQRISFAQAMATPALRICLTNLVHARRAATHRSPP